MVLLYTEEAYKWKSANISMMNIQKNCRNKKNENMNIEIGTVFQNNTINIIEHVTVVDTKDMEMITYETGYILDIQCKEND